MAYGGTVIVSLGNVLNLEFNIIMKQLKARLLTEEEKYVRAVKLSKDYHTLGAIRDDFRHIKGVLAELDLAHGKHD